MRNMRRIGAVMVLLTGIATLSGAEEGDRDRIDALMLRWETALISEDIDALIDCYWDDAFSATYGGNTPFAAQDGSAEIRREQEGWFSQLDYPSLGLDYPEPVRAFPGRGAMPLYIYDNGDSGFLDLFYYEKRDGDFRIANHVLIILPR